MSNQPSPKPRYTMSEAALEARRRGGKARSQNREEMARIGRLGAKSTWTKYKMVAVGTSKHAMVHRKTNRIVAIFNK